MDPVGKSAGEGDGLTWPKMRGYDYRYGFPLCEDGVAEVQAMPESVHEEILALLEAAAFEAVVRCDLAELPLST